MSVLVFGLITGMLFGFLMQKARVIRYDKQIGALRAIDRHDHCEIYVVYRYGCNGRDIRSQ
jgi:hypothetical protein